MLKPVERLTVAAAALALAPRLLHRGMFFDGVIYATLSRNLAAGRGRFWEPFYTETLLPRYHDNPPLAIGIQSLWFRVLGDHLYVERLYDATCTAAVVLLIVAMWRRLLLRSEDSGSAWLPVLLWLSPPIASWTMVGNMLETTLIVFTTAAVAAIVIAVDSRGKGRTIAWAAVSGVCIAGAVLTKGPVAFFPLAAPVLLIVLGDRRGERPLERCALCVGGQFFALSAAAIVIVAWPEARASLSAYVSRQLVPALGGAGNPNPAPRLQLLSVLVQQVIVSLGVVAAAIVALARGFIVPTTSDRRWGVAFITLALAATLPIMVSTKQTGYYFAPAIPFYAIGVAVLIRRTSLVLAERARPAVNGLAALLATLAIVGCLTGTGRDRVLLAELDRLERDLPRNETIRMCSASATDWTLHAWFARRFAISLDPVDVPPPGLFLQTGGQSACAPVTCEALSKADAWLVLRRCG
jgi:4-amino-4-deoxy-L-arabinose transferase-like glycosyltransferase